MQKSKNATIIVIAILFIYGMINTFNFSMLSLAITNPLIWITVAVFLRLAIGKNIENQKFKKAILEYTIIAILVYIITYMLSGLVVTFGKNPYNTTIKGLIVNLWRYGTVIVAKEYIRYKLINNVYEKDKTLICILISVAYILIELELSKFVGRQLTLYFIVKYLFQIGLPIIAKNITFSYTARYCSCMPSIYYLLLTNLYYWVSPITPNTPWIMTSIVDTMIPLVLLLYIRYTKNKLNIFRKKEDIINSDPRSIIPLIILVVLAIWFSIGIFPVKPVAIASGSMYPQIHVGDVVIIKKCNANDVTVKDIIEYRKDKETYVHRIIEKNQKDGSYTFITKGDNNNTPDSDPVLENQLIGKVILRIRYIGYPAIWLQKIRNSNI
ncbi:MAG: signal peptidase I [Clostridia bacterium]|nr:signal peptidase I [Clostridia bacterium]